MKNNKKTIHYVPEDNNVKFLLEKEVTKCGLTYSKINDFTSDIKYVTCLHCTKLINTLINLNNK